MAAGIDDIAIYIPQLYVEASDFAKARGLDPEKLERGLGIGQMAIVDTNQDPACLASNACLKSCKKTNCHLMKLADCMLQQNQHLMNQRQ